MSSQIALAAGIAALWPVWVWCAGRMADRSDDPLGVVALIAAVVIAVYVGGIRKIAEPILVILQSLRASPVPESSGTSTRPAVVGVFICFALYAVTAAFLPMLIRAGFAVTAVALLASPMFFGRRLHLPTYGLLLLSLPIVATMQFYLGYPMRLFVTNAVHALLACAGYAVSVVGTDLVWRGHIVGIDPACSGVRMLWTAFFVCFVLAGMNNLSNRRTAALAIATLGVAFGGNVFRATLLFMVEVLKANTAFVEPAWLHSGIGIVLFGFTAIAISVIAPKEQKSLTAASASTTQTSETQDSSRTAVRREGRGSGALVMAGIALAFAAPYMVPTTQPAQATQTLAFPATFEQRRLTPLPLTQQEQEFAANFPGRIAKFSDGKNTLIMRIVTVPTRQLHPSEDCFRGLGYTVHSLPNMHVDSTTWGAFRATPQSGPPLTVRERITDTNGNSYTDVSAWYWSALLQNSHGPWLATTVASRATDLN